MIPQPSKRSFGHPFPVEALAHLVDPEPGHEFSKPFRDAEGNVVTWNGALAVRIRTYLPHDEIDFAERSFEDLGLCLGEWPDKADTKGKDAKLWKLLDDDAGRLWRFDPKPAWIMRGGQVTANKGTAVTVGAGFPAPLALVQLCARLPACRVKVDNSASWPLRMVWNGGEAILRPVADLPTSAFSVLRPKWDPIARDYTFS